MKTTLRTILAVLCILVITVCAMLLFQKLVGRARVDLTDHGLYTLSEGTRNILSKLNQPVRLKLYYARAAAMKGPEQIRYYNNYYLYVRDLLEEYVNLSHGSLTLSVIDPRRFSDEEEDAIRHGVKRFPLSEDEDFFFGLVAGTELGKEKVIPFFEPARQEFVEYDISKIISSVTRREKTKIGVISPLPVLGSGVSPYMMQMMRMQGRTPEKSWAIMASLRDEYEVVPVQGTGPIPDDIDFLMLIHPKEMPPKARFAIDQYVMKGGKLIVFVDPHCLSDQPPRDPRNPYAAMNHRASSELNVLLRKWGVEMDPELIAADRALAIKASVRRNQPPAPILTYLALNETCVSRDEVMTARLHSLRMLFAGVLTPVEGAGTTVTPLLTTTRTGNTWHPSSPFELQMIDPEAIRRAVSDGTEPLMLACRITGNLKTNFPDGPPPDEKSDKEEKAKADAKKEDVKKQGDETVGGKDEDAGAEKDKAEEPRVIREASPDAVVLVFADVDMISDMLAYQETFFGTAQTGDNASLVFNALEFLSGSGDLIAIRSRGLFSRPFHVVDEIEARAEAETASEVEAVNKKIADYRKKLDELHGSAADEKDAKLVRSKALAERVKVQEEIRKARKELRRLNAGKREKIEALKASLQTHNMVWAPAVVLLIAIMLAGIRHVKAKRYAARRVRE